MYQNGIYPNMMMGNYANMYNGINTMNNMSMMGAAGRVGMLSRFKTIDWSGLLNNTSRTLNIINQAIPIVNQVKPLATNMKTMFKIASIMKENNTPSNGISETVKQVTNKVMNNDVNQPTFFS